jgi:hypothetical protein
VTPDVYVVPLSIPPREGHGSDAMTRDAGTWPRHKARRRARRLRLNRKDPS